VLPPGTAPSGPDPSFHPRPSCAAMCRRFPAHERHMASYSV
jgi:hypothetical protein